MKACPKQSQEENESDHQVKWTPIQVKNCAFLPLTTLSLAGYKMLYGRFLSRSLCLTMVKAALCFCVAAEKSGNIEMVFPLYFNLPSVRAMCKICSLSLQCRSLVSRG